MSEPIDVFVVVAQGAAAVDQCVAVFSDEDGALSYIYEAEDELPDGMILEILIETLNNPVSLESIFGGCE